MRYELTDHEWAAIKSMLPNKPRGVARVNDRRALNGIFWVLRRAVFLSLAAAIVVSVGMLLLTIPP
jgi:transposase